jgi:hypothetical protein
MGGWRYSSTILNLGTKFRRVGASCPWVGLAVTREEKYLLPLQGFELRFLGRLAHSLVPVPTEVCDDGTLVQILCFWTLSIVLSLSKNTVLFILYNITFRRLDFVSVFK